MSAIPEKFSNFKTVYSMAMAARMWSYSSEGAMPRPGIESLLALLGIAGTAATAEATTGATAEGMDDTEARAVETMEPTGLTAVGAMGPTGLTAVGKRAVGKRGGKKAALAEARRAAVARGIRVGRCMVVGSWRRMCWCGLM